MCWEGFWGLNHAEIPDLPIPGLGYTGIWQRSGVWLPCASPAVSGAIFKFELHKVETGGGFFFPVVVSNQRKKGNGSRLLNILSVASLFVQGVCVRTWIGRQ